MQSRSKMCKCPERERSNLKKRRQYKNSKVRQSSYYYTLVLSKQTDEGKQASKGDCALTKASDFLSEIQHDFSVWHQYAILEKKHSNFMRRHSKVEYQ